MSRLCGVKGKEVLNKKIIRGKMPGMMMQAAPLAV